MRSEGAEGMGPSGVGQETGARLATSRLVRLNPGGPRALVVLALLTLAVLASALAGPWTITTSGGAVPAPQVSVPPVALETPRTPPVPGTRHTPRQLDLRPVLWVGIVVLSAFAAWFARSLLARRVPDVEPGIDEIGPDGDEADRGVVPHEPSVASLRAGLVEAAARLRQGGEPSDAVVASWVALEDAASRSGVRRDPAATPTEFALEVLGRTSADRDATRSLLARYERARFSGLPVTDDDVEGAAADLEVLAATLHAAGDAPGPGGIR